MPVPQMLSEKFSDPFSRSRRKEPISNDAMILTGNFDKDLASRVASMVGKEIPKLSVRRFADGEVAVRIDESVNGKHCYIIQSSSPPVNDNLMELILLISACKRGGAHRVTCIVPYYGYARQERRDERISPISSSDVAQILEHVGADHIVAMDLHSPAIQGATTPKVCFDNISVFSTGLSYF